jgi:orotidine-5'-phosphate decarboxylase
MVTSMNTPPAPASYLSTKPIPVNERLIVALDVPSADEARRMVEALGDSVVFYKVGLELFMAGDYFELVEWLIAHGKKVFVDLKFFDVPQTVQSAVHQLTRYGASFATVHGNDAILAAAASVKGDLKLLAVTVLTSLDQGDIDDLGFKTDVRELVLSRARRAVAAGCDGVIASGIEAPQLREQLGNDFIVVSPGIRPVKNTDDQKRTVDVEEAFLNGADLIVVGRPIKQPVNFATPREAADDIQRRIGLLFGASG